MLEKISCERDLKEHDVINLAYIGMYEKYKSNVVRHNEVPTLTTKCYDLLVIREEE